jgi:hypothetical protein
MLFMTQSIRPEAPFAKQDASKDGFQAALRSFAETSRSAAASPVVLRGRFPARQDEDV